MGLINKANLGSLFSMMPDVKTVNLLKRQAGSVLGEGVTSKAEKRPIDSNERKLAEIAVDTDACVWHVWPSTFSDVSYKPQPSDLVEETDGTRWEVVSLRLEMMETRYKATCVQVFT